LYLNAEYITTYMDSSPENRSYGPAMEQALAVAAYAKQVATERVEGPLPAGHTSEEKSETVLKPEGMRLNGDGSLDFIERKTDTKHNLISPTSLEREFPGLKEDMARSVAETMADRPDLRRPA